MRLNNVQKIFTPSHHNLLHGVGDYAQSPQAIIVDNKIRIYFTTRFKDSDHTYISYPSYIECDMDFEILNIANHEVLPKGLLGSYFEHGVFPFSPFKDKDNHISALISGWSRRKSVPVETAIGLATSLDGGVSFTAPPGPVLSASHHAPFLVVDGYLRKYNNLYYMWYIYGVRWKETQDGRVERVYKISFATSSDLIHWSPSFQSIIPDMIDPDECQALPSVICYKDIYYMFFCYRSSEDFRGVNSQNSYKLDYATSTDLQTWTRHNDLEIEHDPECQMMCYPSPIQVKDKLYLLYNQDQFGKFGFVKAEVSI